ncbi:MAG TPA: Rieske (2Fe-2S) protein [Gammaproteobacteria bacterium]|nr:Rieske (2Fe-2S) protein [Gammaproteobacteria bacterium]
MNAPDTDLSPLLVWPEEGETRAPYQVYLDEKIFEQEQQNIFRGPAWSFLGLDVEVPEPGDFKSTFVGDTPVVLSRDSEGQLHAFVNRCAHRGALVCRELRGNTDVHTCVYHQWAFSHAGDLVGVPFRRGLAGKGGYPKDFDMAEHGLQKLRVDQVQNMVFATFDQNAPELEQFLGDEMCGNIRRVMQRPIKVLGHARQFFNGNWKLYSENARDSYHGGLLHLFYPTFGIYRQGQTGSVHVDDSGMHMLLKVSEPDQEQSIEAYQQASSRKADEGASLADPRLLEYRRELGDETMLTIQSLFPSVVVQQISNTLAVRQILPKAVDQTELVWTFYTFADDSEEMIEHRQLQINMVGPAGFISMEDGEAVEICQRAIVRDGDKASFIEMGGIGTGSIDHMGVDENPIRGFWKGYRALMGV